MADTPPRRGGITMLDATALVTGAAVASVHSREFTEILAGLTILGWVFLGLAFLWLALTSAGPFVYLVRRWVSRPEGYPTAADRLWLALGLPWLIAALYRSSLGASFDQSRRTYEISLQIGLCIVAVLALGWVAVRWSRTNAESGSKAVKLDMRSWTELVGSAIVVMWPLQLGLALVVIR